MFRSLWQGILLATITCSFLFGIHYQHIDHTLFQTGAVPVRIIIDPSNPDNTEVSVIEGGVVQLTPQVLDSSGAVIRNAPLTYVSTNPEIATADSTGNIQGRKVGFSTLTLSSGSLVVAATVTVVSVTSGGAGFEITGIAQDQARGLYLAYSSNHVILRAQDLLKTPDIYAGVSSSPGFSDDERLKALFRNPRFLAFNQFNRNLFVSDGANHAVRRVRPGDPGRVETLAGNGQPGAADGPPRQASFNSPQGIALDQRGNLWVVDSANHTIRKIKLNPDTKTYTQVETIAGKPGLAGLADGVGDQARFSSPSGIAIETESLAQQLQREARGEPPPPVSVIVADTSNGRVRRVTETGQVETVVSVAPKSSLQVRIAGQPLQFAAKPIVLDKPTGVAVDSFGNLYVSESNSSQVKTILQNGAVVTAAPPNTFVRPAGIAITQSGKLVVAEAGHTAQQISYGGPQIASIIPTRISNRSGTRVVVKGKNLAPETVVVVGGTVITGATVNDTQTLTFTAPALPSGLNTLTVQNRGGLDQAALFIDAARLADLPAAYITTVAGGSSFAGDGSLATSASLSFPWGISLDSAGNVYVTEPFNNRVRRVNSRTGVIHTVAGNGRLDFSGDGGPATAASLSSPTGITVDNAGNLFIVDKNNRRVRKVDAATRVITTVAGGGQPADNLGDNGPATKAALKAPNSVAVDGQGNLFISDSGSGPGSGRIRKVGVDGIIQTVAGGGSPVDNLGDGGLATSARLDSPDGITVDAAGDLVVADTDNNRIRKIDARTGIITTVAGGAFLAQDGVMATATSLSSPHGVAVDADGNLFIADFGYARVRKVSRTNNVINTVAGSNQLVFLGDNGPATDAAMAPFGVAVDAAGNLFIADVFNSRVRKVDAISKFITTFAGTGSSYTGDGGPATAAALNVPFSIYLDSVGNIYIADTINNRIRRVDVATGFITTVAGNGNLGFSGDGGPAVNAELAFPQGVAVDNDGDVFIAETFYHRIRKVDSRTKLIVTIAGMPGEPGFSGDGTPASLAKLNLPRGIVVDPASNLYIADSGNHRILKIDAATQVITTVAGTGTRGFSGDGGPAVLAAFNEPWSIALDRAGNIYVADTSNLRVRKIDAKTRVVNTVAGTGSNPSSADPAPDGRPAIATAIATPYGVATDASGNLFISTTLDKVFKVASATGLISTLAGNGLIGLSGDNGPAVEASLNVPTAISVDGEGNIFIVDGFNHRIRGVRAPATVPPRPRRRP
ncbi:MAG TPA: IPT/TIG domain-containing protein [Acidobacteriota bacterium]|nr:IPT/TIG domain-containing protein [Acidobacteriota bacterium]